LTRVAQAENQAAVRLRPAIAADRFRIRGWLADPQVQAWWGNAARAEAAFTLAITSPAAVCRVVECDGLPVGYAQAIEIGMLGEATVRELPAGTWAIDLFIASAKHRGHGVGPAALLQLTEEIFSTTLAVACCAMLSIRNEAAVRAFEHAGFRWLRIYRDALTGPVWLMLKERPSSSTAQCR
jgi:aminoglycoside 6'-N-acetyltransferase